MMLAFLMYLMMQKQAARSNADMLKSPQIGDCLRIENSKVTSCWSGQEWESADVSSTPASPEQARAYICLQYAMAFVCAKGDCSQLKPADLEPINQACGYIPSSISDKEKPRPEPREYPAIKREQVHMMDWADCPIGFDQGSDVDGRLCTPIPRYTCKSPDTEVLEFTVSGRAFCRKVN